MYKIRKERRHGIYAASEYDPERTFKMKWYLKQLLPLSYRTQYTDGEGKHDCRWRMWFGRCFAVDDRIIG